MEKISKFAKIVLWVLMIISVGLFLILVTSIESQDNPGPRAEQFIAYSINWAILMGIIAGVIVVVFTLIQLFSDKKRALSSLVILAIFALVVGVSYAVSTSDIPQFFGVDKFVADGTITPSIVRWIGTGLVSTYILFGAAILSIVVFGASSILKQRS